MKKGCTWLDAGRGPWLLLRLANNSQHVKKSCLVGTCAGSSPVPVQEWASKSVAGGPSVGFDDGLLVVPLVVARNITTFNDLREDEQCVGQIKTGSTHVYKDILNSTKRKKAN